MSTPEIPLRDADGRFRSPGVRMPALRHWHVWRVADTGSGAFVSRAYLVRGTANAAAERWTGNRGQRRDGRSGYAFVRECTLLDHCPRPPVVIDQAGGRPGGSSGPEGATSVPHPRVPSGAPRGSRRSLTGTQRATLAGRLARALDAPAGKVRVALDAAPPLVVTDTVSSVESRKYRMQVSRPWRGSIGRWRSRRRARPWRCTARRSD